MFLLFFINCHLNWCYALQRTVVLRSSVFFTPRRTDDRENESCSYSQYLQSNIPPPGLEHRNSAPLRTRDQSLINPLLLQNSWADFSCRNHRNVLSRHICVSIPDLIFSSQTPPLQHSLHIKIQLKYSGFYWLYLDILKDISGTGLGLGNGGPYQCTLQ